jgi:hypothetical protein
MIKYMKKQRTISAFLTILLLALPLGGRATAQGIVGVRLSGGAAWSFGSSFRNVGANEANVLQPVLGAGVTVKVLPQFRVGLGYDYSQMVREQLNGTLEPISGSVLPGSVEGTVYSDFKTRFHAAGLSAEYNVLPVGGPVSLYVGTGFGCLFAQGNTWALSVRNEMRSDNWTSTVTINGQNEFHYYAAPFIPATVSLECRILPQTSVCVGGLYRLVLSKNDLAPKGQACATLGLRLDF